MKKLISLLLLIGTVLSCSNPLDSVYNEPTFNNDIKLIKDVNEEDSDRIIDQVKYADEIKPGTTYREILDEYHLRRNLLIKILEFYEQESSKERFDYKDYIQINIDSEKALECHSKRFLLYMDDNLIEGVDFWFYKHPIRKAQGLVAIVDISKPYIGHQCLQDACTIIGVLALGVLQKAKM